MNMAYEFDSERARLVVSRVHDAFKRGTGLLAETDDLVENQIPKYVLPLSKEHALFLFFVVANDHGMKSTRLYDRAKNLFLERRDLFNPHEVVRNFTGPEDPRLIESTGKYLGTRYPKETAKAWYLNSVGLLEKYEGDPKCLFQSTSDARILIKRIRAFRGYGPKIGGMLLRAAIGLGFAKVSGIEEVLVPVDIHDSRISFLTGIFKTKTDGIGKPNYYAFVTHVQKMLLNTCNSLDLEWLDTDRALWLIGSRGCVSRRCSLCPLSDICEIGKEVTARAVNVSNPEFIKRGKKGRNIPSKSSALEKSLF